MADPSLWTMITTLAPSSVAAIAMIVTASQNKWQRSFSDRQQRLAAQQLSLSLLDRRILVLDAIRDVIARYYTADSDTGREESLFHVVHSAHAIFPAELADRLSDAWVAQVALNDLKRARLRATKPEIRDNFTSEYEAFREPFLKKLQALHRDLIESTRVVA